MIPQDMHTPILNMRVLLPLGVNNPASLVIFPDDRPYDMKSEYVIRMILGQIDVRSYLQLTIYILRNNNSFH